MPDGRNWLMEMSADLREAVAHSTTSRANPTRLSSLKGKEKNVSKKFYLLCISPLISNTQRCSEDRAKPSRIKA